MNRVPAGNSRRILVAFCMATTVFISMPTFCYATSHSTSQTIQQQQQAAPCRSWINPERKTRLVVLCIHGLGLQSNSFEFFGKAASATPFGIAVYAIDVRGFGAWMNAKGRQKVNFDECLEDIKQTLESIRASNPGVPVYLLGESMGGAIALRAASMYPDLIDGLISSVPAEERFKQGKTNIKVFLHILGGGANKDFNIGNSIVDQATKDDDLKKEWKGDPLDRMNLSPKELVQFQEFMNDNHDAAKKVVDMPVLIVQGTGDKLVKPEGTWELFNSVASDDKAFFAIPGEHLIFEEAQTQDPKRRTQNMAVIAAWLDSKVGLRKLGPGRLAGGPMAGNMRPGSGRGQLGPGRLAGGAPFGDGQFDSVIASKSPDLQGSIDLINNGSYDQAIAELEKIRAQRPDDPGVSALLGKAYFKSGDTEQGRNYFFNAMRLGRGDQLSRSANEALLQIGQSSPQAVLSRGPSTGVANGAVRPDAGQLGGDAGMNGINRMGRRGQLLGRGRMGARFGFNQGGTAGAATGGARSGPFGKPKMYAFYADWAEQCQSLKDDLQQLSVDYGSQMDIIKVNIEDPNSQPLIEQFKIGPIPTVVFVAADGTVSSTIIGASSAANYKASADKLTGRPRFRPLQKRGAVQ